MNLSETLAGDTGDSMKRALIVPALTIITLSAAPLSPLKPSYSEIPNNSPRQVMAAPVMEQASQRVQIASERVEPTPIPTPQPTVAPRAFTGDVSSMLRAATAARFGSGQVEDMMTLMGKESGLNPYAVNKTSGACGIPQAYPCSKLLSVIGSLDNVPGQIAWLLDYVARRYGTPSKPLAFHRSNGWY